MKKYLFIIAGVLIFFSCKEQNPQQLTAPPEPAITLKFGNPQTIGNKYNIDIMATSEVPNKEILGINVRFFYDAAMFTSSVVLKDFAGGYGLHTPGQPLVFVGSSGTKVMFSFKGATTVVNGGLQLNSPSKPDVLLNPGEWDKICTIELTLHAGQTSTCPTLVWDNFNAASFLPGSEGVVIALVPKDYALEKVEHLNWVLTGTEKFKYPYGVPVPCNLPQ